MTLRLGMGIAIIFTSWALLAQEVKMNEYPNPEFVGSTSFGPKGPGFVWGSFGGFCGGQGAGVFRFQDFRGTFTTPEIQSFASCNASGGSDLAMLSSGELIVVGAGPDGVDTGVMVRLFDPSLNPMGPEFLVNQITSGEQGYGRVAALASGRFAVIWAEPNSLKRLAGRIVLSDGSMPGAEVTFATLPAGWGESFGYPRIASSGTGLNVIWSYEDPPQNHGELRSRPFDDALVPVGPEIDLTPAQAGLSLGPYDIAGGGTGYMVCWHRQDVSGANPRILGRVVDASGIPTTPEFIVEDYATPYYYSTNVTCAVDASGRSIVTWNGDGTQGFTVYAKRFDSAGNPAGTKFPVPTNSPDPQKWPVVAASGNGDFVIAWRAEWLQGSNVHADLVERRYSFPVSIVVSPGPGSANAPLIRTVRPDGRIGWPVFQAYGAGGFGANVGAGDFDGDSIAEILTGPGPSGSYGPQVRAFQRDGTAIQKVSFFAYGTLKYGVRPAFGNIDTDAYAEILTAPGPGAVFSPHIRAWNYDNAKVEPDPRVNFYAYSTLKYGARVAAGDIDGDGIREILTAPGPGPMFGPHIRAFNYDGTQLTSMGKVSFYAFPNGKYGATVAASDVESDGIGGYGDGYQEIVVGAGPDPDPTVLAKVRLFDYDSTAVAFKYEIQPYTTPRGVNVAGGDIDAGDTEEVVTAPGPDASNDAHIIAWEWDPVIGVNPDAPCLQKLGPDDFTAFAGMTYGANVAVGTFE